MCVREAEIFLMKTTQSWEGDRDLDTLCFHVNVTEVSERQ